MFLGIQYQLIRLSWSGSAPSIPRASLLLQPGTFPVLFSAASGKPAFPQAPRMPFLQAPAHVLRCLAQWAQAGLVLGKHN